MCKNWRERGACKYGDKCLFAHGDHELTKRSSALPAKEEKPKEPEPTPEPAKTNEKEKEKEVVKEPEKAKRTEANDGANVQSTVQSEAKKQEKDDSFETPKKATVNHKEKLMFSTTKEIVEKSTQEATHLALSTSKTYMLTNQPQKGEDDDAAHCYEEQKLLMMINGDLNDLLDREIQKVALPSKKIVIGGVSTHPSSMSKSPLEAYTDSMDIRGAMASNQDSSHSQRSSFDDTLNTFNLNEISNKGRRQSSSCAEEEANLIGEGLFNEIEKSEEHLSSEEETLAHEAASEI